MDTTELHTLKPITRLLCLAVLGGAALLLDSCADTAGYANGACPDGTTTCTNPLPVQCPAGKTFTQIGFNPNTGLNDGMVSTATSGLCIGCSVVDAIDVVDVYTNNFAIMTVSAGLLGAGDSITVTDTKASFPAGSEGGFVVSLPNGAVATVDLLQNEQVTTINNGTDTVDTAGNGSPVVLDLLGAGLIGNQTLVFITAGTSTVPYNAVRLNLTGVASVLSQLYVYGAGVCQ